MKVLAGVSLGILLLFSGCSKGTDFADSAVVLTNCTLIDGTGAGPLSNAAVVIDAGLIVAVGSANSIAIPDGAAVIDVEGATVLPGFFNVHIHHGYNEDNLSAWARAGVTTVRDLAGPSSFAWRDQKAENPYCALLVAAGPMISVPNGYPLVPWGSPYMLPVTSAEDTRIKVAGLLESGADLVKLAVECGQDFRLDIPTLTAEEAAAAVNTAHEHGTVASAHVLVAYDLARAVAAGADDIAHMVIDSIPDSLIEVMVDEDILWVPTLELWHLVAYDYPERARANLRKFVQAGGSVAVGTDYDGYYGTFQLGMPINEMEWMLEAGMSPMQVIVAGTKNSARACNRQDDLGTLEVGKIADVLVVNGNPLEDIRDLESVRLVIHRGVIIRMSTT